MLPLDRLSTRELLDPTQIMSQIVYVSRKTQAIKSSDITPPTHTHTQRKLVLFQVVTVNLGVVVQHEGDAKESNCKNLKAL